MTSTSRATIATLVILLLASIVACQFSASTPPPTATVAPTPTVNPQTIIPLPQLGLILSTLSERYESFNIVTSWGLAPDTLVYVGFEVDGNLHMAVYAWVGERWALVGVMDVDGVPQAQN